MEEQINGQPAVVPKKKNIFRYITGGLCLLVALLCVLTVILFWSNFLPHALEGDNNVGAAIIIALFGMIAFVVISAIIGISALNNLVFGIVNLTTEKRGAYIACAVLTIPDGIAGILTLILGFFMLGMANDNPEITVLRLPAVLTILTALGLFALVVIKIVNSAVGCKRLKA